jgi:NAD(P)-dependent dehydrogenase (short-subunit alcohol dehydrogenase family)
MTGPGAIGLLYPGDIGAAVGRCLAEHGHRVLWASAGRGEQTAARARAAGLPEGFFRAAAEIFGRYPRSLPEPDRPGAASNIWAS